VRFVPTSESADRCKSVPARARGRGGAAGERIERDKAEGERRNVFHLSFYLGLPLSAPVTKLSIRARHPSAILSPTCLQRQDSRLYGISCRILVRICLSRFLRSSLRAGIIIRLLPLDARTRLSTRGMVYRLALTTP